MFDERFMRHALELSKQALIEPGTEPFAAVVVKGGKIIGEGLNHSLANFDPTSHGETEAIRNACQNLRTVILTGCDLYTTCEPCALCVAAMYISGIKRLYYAASLEQADHLVAQLDDSARHYFDLAGLRQESGSLVKERSIPSEQRMDGEALPIIREWVKRSRGLQ